MASPPFNISTGSPAASSFISAFPPNEQTSRDVINSWLLAISTNMGVLRADAMPDLFEADMTFEDTLRIDASDSDADPTLVFRDSTGAVQARIFWDQSADTLAIVMYQDDGSTPRGTLAIAGDSDNFQYNGSTVLRANSAVASALIGVGALDSGSITDGFGSIDIGNSTLEAGNTLLAGTLGVTGILSAGSTIEVGHASDTTLARAAAGFLSVEGKRIPSPASQTAGDMLVRGSTEWDRLAIGTAGQVLRTNGAGTAPEWSSAARPAGDAQSWQNVSGSRNVGTSYQNTTGRAIMVSITLNNAAGTAQVSTNNSTWITVGTVDSSGVTNTVNLIIPDQHYYRVTGSGSASQWVELR